MKVLIAEDMASIRMVFKDILVRYCGLQEDNIYLANDGNHAVSEYFRIKPDLVFMDILMPHLDGKGALREIIKDDPNAHILMCSTATEAIEECMREGAKGYILKPITPYGVKKALEKFTHKENG